MQQQFQFFKYPGLVVEKKRVSGSGKPGL